MTPAVRLLAAAPVLLAACESNPGSGPSAGMLAYFSGGGEVSVIDFSSGDTATFDVPSGEPRGLALSPDRTSVAFIVRVGLRRHVYRGDVDTGDVEEISPPARGDSFLWGHGYFLYRVRVDGRDGDAVVVEGETEARMLGESTVVASGAPVVAYVSEQRLFVEHILTGERTELAESATPVLFIQDGNTLLASVPDSEPGAYPRFVTFDVDDGTPTDVGPAGSTLHGDLSLLSPDESEILVSRFDAITAMRLDGSAERVVWGQIEPFTGPWVVGFTAAGDIVYVIEENLTPDTDTPEVVDHLWIDRGGVSERLSEGKEICNGPFASGTGALVAWPCHDATHVFSVADGAEILAIPGFATVLGFDRAEQGFILAPWSPDNELLWVDLAGNQQHLASPSITDPWTMAFAP